MGGVSVAGNNYVGTEKILNITGLQKGMEVDVPGEGLSSIVNRLWLMSGYFEDVSVAVDSIVPTQDTAFFKISVIERPRVSAWTFSGIKSGEQKELMERLNLKRGGVFSDYVAKTAKDDLGSYIATGIAGVFFFHMLENIGMTMGLLPITGIPLPFVSYGGSSLLSNFIMIGLLLNISGRRQKAIFID